VLEVDKLPLLSALRYTSSQLTNRMSTGLLTRMHKSYFGVERQILFDWLTREWIAEGSTACFVEGFPGVGKSDLATALSSHVESTRGWTSIYVEVPDRVAPLFTETLLEVAQILASRGKTAMLDAMHQENPNPAYALERALRDDVLIVVDEAGRLLGNNGQATSELLGIFSHLRNRVSLRGRILLLSDVVIERNRWSEVFPIKPLLPPSLAEAVELLTDRLVTSGHPDAVPTERKADLVRILGQNPRAIETLVATLTFESLDEVIGREPGMWEVYDRAVSPEFLEGLERRLLERTLSHLQSLELRRLSMLAVHRRSFESAAFEAVTSGARKEWRDLRHTLASRFLVSLRLQWHALNPLVREISLSRLRGNSTEFKTAHSLAADYHMRHFRARNLVLENQQLTTSYAELRYHLFHAGRTQDLRDVALQLSDHFTFLWRSNSQVPQEPAELDERIGVLSALLQDDGPKSLEHYLARCLKARGSERDLQQALVHIVRVTSENTRASDAWLLRAQLHFDLRDPNSSVQACIDAVRVADPGGAIGPLYVFGARVFSQQGHIADAVKFLREGILVVPPSNGLFSLYVFAAELLRQEGKNDAAHVLLKEGIRVIPPDKSLGSLYVSAATLLGETGQPNAALDLLKEGIKVIPADKDLSSLYLAAADLLGEREETEAALDLLKEGMKVIPVDKDLHSLYLSAFGLLRQAGKPDAALVLLQEGIKLIPRGKGVELLYRSSAELLRQLGRIDEALDLLKEGIKVIPADKELGALYGATVELLMTAPPSSMQNGTKGKGSLGVDSSALGEKSNPRSSPIAHGSINAGATIPSKDQVLLMATEWLSVHGGLSTFNRQLCRAFASLGHTTVCAVPLASDEEIQDASRGGVVLVVASSLPGSEPLNGLYRPLALPPGFTPNVIVGHGRITGAAAKVQSTDHFPAARRIHFVHMASGEIDWFKEGENHAALSEAREYIERDLAVDADLVVAVGPRLRREFSDLLRGMGTQKVVHEFVPGPDPADRTAPPQLNHCLVLGRVDDYALKGLDIAARALGLVIASRRFVGTPPELVVRGAKPGTSADLRKRLQGECDGIDLAVRIREYDSSEETIESDLRRATLVLMPSRREGFGLVALEALSKGVPVLVSDKSGFGEVLQRTASEIHARNAVVTTPQEVEAAARNWADAIALQLLDPTASFSRASELSKFLAQTLGWKAAVQSLVDTLGRR
jgi:glycosyltransferase involved in cell wall biosynthesis